MSNVFIMVFPSRSRQKASSGSGSGSPLQMTRPCLTQAATPRRRRNSLLSPSAWLIASALVSSNIPLLLIGPLAMASLVHSSPILNPNPALLLPTSSHLQPSIVPSPMQAWAPSDSLLLSPSISKSNPSSRNGISKGPFSSSSKNTSRFILSHTTATNAPPQKPNLLSDVSIQPDGRQSPFVSAATVPILSSYSHQQTHYSVPQQSHDNAQPLAESRSLQRRDWVPTHPNHPANVLTANEEWKGIQSGDGYVFARQNKPQSPIALTKRSLSRILTIRDMHVSHPPLIPNSNSRLLVGLMVGCIIGVGLLTFLAQELYARFFPSPAQEQTRRRTSQSYFDHRPASRLRSAASSPILPDAMTSMSMKQEEEQILTPPAVSRYHQQDSDLNPNGQSRQVTHDDGLHYLPLPFGLGIGYSFDNLSDQGGTRARLDKMVTASVTGSRQPAKSRSRSKNTGLIQSTGAQLGILPTSAGTSSTVGTNNGLRSRARSFKEFRKDAISASSASRDIGMIAEEDGNPDGDWANSDSAAVTSRSSSRWLSTDHLHSRMDGVGSSNRGGGNGVGNGVGSNSSSSSNSSNMTSPTPSGLRSIHSRRGSNTVDGLAIEIGNGKGKSRSKSLAIPPQDESYTLVDLGSGLSDSLTDVTPSSSSSSALSNPFIGGGDLVDPISASFNATLSQRSLSLPSPFSSSSLPTQSAIARHPHVEQLRRQGRSEGGRRIGKGTPTAIIKS